MVMEHYLVSRYFRRARRPRRMFVRGMGSILDLWPAASPFPFEPPFQRVSALEALRNDWMLVGGDLKSAILQIEGGLGAP